MIARSEKVSDWSHGWDETPYPLKKSVVKQIEAKLHDFLSVRRVEPTYIERIHGAPSWMIRVEGVIHNDTFHVFEVEDRPAGIGMLKKYVNPEGLRLHFQEWRDVCVVDSGSRNGIDDHHWGARIVSLDEARTNRSLVLVRARPEEEVFHALVDQAVAPVAYEGDKRYGERLGWWYRVSKTSENLPLILALAKGSAVVIKPFVGTRARGVYVYVPEHLQAGLGVSGCHDIRSFKTVEKQIKTPQGCFIQPFVLPMRFSWRPKEEGGIVRVYFRYSIKEGVYKLLEGCPGFWNTRPNNLVIHGTQDACFGPLTVE